MIKSTVSRSVLAASILIAPWALLGCDSATNTTMPSNPPPIPTDAKGNPVPPPSAAGGAPAK